MASPPSNIKIPRLVSGSVVSVVERIDDKKTRYVFELNLDWSDDTDSIIFRGYQDFFEFHCQLLDAFPKESGTIKGCDRTIPYLPGKQLFRRSTRSLALQRLPKLNDYLQDLIKLPDKVMTSHTVLNFLRDNWGKEKHKYIVQDKTDEDLVSSMRGVLHVDDGIRVRFINNHHRTNTLLASEITDKLYFNQDTHVAQTDEEENKNEEGDEEITDIQCLLDRKKSIPKWAYKSMTL